MKFHYLNFYNCHVTCRLQSNVFLHNRSLVKILDFSYIDFNSRSMFFSSSISLKVISKDDQDSKFSRISAFCEYHRGFYEEYLKKHYMAKHIQDNLAMLGLYIDLEVEAIEIISGTLAIYLQGNYQIMMTHYVHQLIFDPGERIEPVDFLSFRAIKPDFHNMKKSMVFVKDFCNIVYLVYDTYLSYYKSTTTSLSVDGQVAKKCVIANLAYVKKNKYIEFNEIWIQAYCGMLFPILDATIKIDNTEFLFINDASVI